MKTLASTIFAAAFALLASQANATVLNSATNAGNFLTSIPVNTPTYVPLFPTGVDYLWFYVPTSGSVFISYNAECNVKGHRRASRGGRGAQGRA